MNDDLLRLPEVYRQLLRRHHPFYRSLASGRDRPESDAQHHFVAVCRGTAAPSTPHEHAFMTFRKFCELSGISEDEAVQRDFQFPARARVADVQPKIPKARSPGYSGVKCPRCTAKGFDSMLVWRHARDPSISGEFLGCERYPHCQYKE